MPTAIDLHVTLLIIATAILACLGWSAMSAVWGWVTTGQSSTAAILGAIIVVVVFVALVVVK